MSLLWCRSRSAARPRWLAQHWSGSRAAVVNPSPHRLQVSALTCCHPRHQSTALAGRPRIASTAAVHSSGSRSATTVNGAGSHDVEAPRNAVGVQLLSPSLHKQVFPSTTAKVPSVHQEALSLCQHHLKAHGLEPEQASTLAPISFDLPALQGNDLSQHMWNIGRKVAQPWLGMANRLADATLIEQYPEGVMETNNVSSTAKDGDDGDATFSPEEWLSLDESIRGECRPKLPKWLKKSGWVRYAVFQSEDGMSRALGEGVPVEYPLPEDGSLVFDVETMVQESQFSVMAVAAGANAWYAWLSPWLLQEGERYQEKDHLIPFGPRESSLRAKQPARLLIGHNVGYDRARILDEYSLQKTNIRFLDTMSLHVATRGISSPQRGAWIKHSKSRALEKMLEQNDIENAKKSVIRAILGGEEVDEDIIATLDLEELTAEMQKGNIPANDAIASEQLHHAASGEPDNLASTSILWQDVTSKNSLADVAKLHCNIDLSKEMRDVFIDGTKREEIVRLLDRLLDYCATDVSVTHKVFKKVWPNFVSNCPNPATTAGILGLGSTILPVDDEWTDYIQRCDAKYESALYDVKDNLVQLAEQLKLKGTEGVTWDQAAEAANARLEDIEGLPDLTYADKLARLESERQRPKLWWECQPWASQLDWSPKKPKSIKASPLSNASGEEGKAIMVPRWYRDRVQKSASGLGPSMSMTPSLLRLSLRGRHIVRRADGKWVAKGMSDADDIDLRGSPLRQIYLRKDDGFDVKSGLGQVGEAVLSAIRSGSPAEEVRERLREAADAAVELVKKNDAILDSDLQLSSLDWTPSEPVPERSLSPDVTSADDNTLYQDKEWWPRWYWDLFKSGTGEVEVTIRSKISPLLLCITWQGCPLHHSREHGWVFRYDPEDNLRLLTRQKSLTFKHEADLSFRNDISRTVAARLAKMASAAKGKDGAIIDPHQITPVFYKVPHLTGDGSNVGSPFSKGFLPIFEKGTLKSEHPDNLGQSAAKTALEMNAQCSYWIGVRDRVRQQMVIWEGEGGSDLQMGKGISGARQDDQSEAARRKGIILPQIIPMGTVTRRAIEKTWLTASNAKPNRVGSELKAMVKAPPGWSIVGADVDSQELWICSVMGDAQFGIHGATAIGWMTLEGSKTLGTDLHSKTAGILGTNRNQAKVFNYSRIYGAGIRHSSQLLLKANPTMSKEQATQKAKELYASTKGTNTYGSEYFGRKFWYGGTESYVFNKLEEIALSEQPKTPALDCGVTAALSKKFLPASGQQGRGRDFSRGQVGGDYMPSRINWVVQSSGVDYLHLLITSMEYLISTYNIHARFMISVHDEVRYLAKDEDADRVALALQIANLWTRATFAHKLQMDNLPQGVAFFAQVDIDKVLRKEADDVCVTPSQPVAIPAGRAVEVQETLNRTNGGSLFADGRSMKARINEAESWPTVLAPPNDDIDISLPNYQPSLQTHRSLGDRGLRFLQAQASDDIAEIASLEERVRHLERQHSHVRQSSASNQSAGRTNRSPSRKGLAGTPSTRDVRDAPSSDMPFGQSMSFHTSCRMSQASTSALPLDIQAIVDLFPAKPRKLHVPFYKTREHGQKILWETYRPLLKLCGTDFPEIREMIRGLARAKRHCTSPKETTAMLGRAETLLRQLRLHHQGDEEMTDVLRQQEKSLGEEHHRKRCQSAARERQRLLREKNAPRPKPSGALLPPSHSNPPLPRYKPFQPDRITMMIKKRRMARFRRTARQQDNAESQKYLTNEVNFWRAVEKRAGGRVDSAWKSSDSWLTALREEQNRFQASFERETRRAKMVFPASMLRYAKRARTAKLLSARERGERLRRQHEQ